MGPFQVLFNHAPIVAALDAGTFKVKNLGGAEENFHISGGFLELHHNEATVLADGLIQP
jgi:F-type H+-transporting ATPase subunit epsilon